MIGFCDGEFLPVEQISIPVTSMGLNRGYAAFEFFQVIHNQAFYGQHHIKRFLRTTELLFLESKFFNRISSIVDEVIARNSSSEFYIKIFAFPGSGTFVNSYKSSLYVIPVNFEPYPEHLYNDGATLLFEKYQRYMPEAKTVNYLAGQYMVKEMHQKNAVDVLYHNGKLVQETSRGNIFAVKNEKVITPAENILYGITRHIAMEILRNENIPCIEGDVSIDEVLNADEVFLTSTRKKIMPVVAIENHTIGKGVPGEITHFVMQKLEEIKNKN